MKTPINTSPQISYLLSFLGILVDRAGGELVIENLSSYSNHNLQLGMKLDTENDRVTLSLSGGITKRSEDECKTHAANVHLGFKFCPDCGNPLSTRR